MVQSAKSVATNMTHPGIIQQWRQNNLHVSLFLSFWCQEIQADLKVLIPTDHYEKQTRTEMVQILDSRKLFLCNG